MQRWGSFLVGTFWDGTLKTDERFEEQLWLWTQIVNLPGPRLPAVPVRNRKCFFSLGHSTLRSWDSGIGRNEIRVQLGCDVLMYLST